MNGNIENDVLNASETISEAELSLEVARGAAPEAEYELPPIEPMAFEPMEEVTYEMPMPGTRAYDMLQGRSFRPVELAAPPMEEEEISPPAVVEEGEAGITKRTKCTLRSL